MGPLPKGRCFMANLKGWIHPIPWSPQLILQVDPGNPMGCLDLIPTNPRWKTRVPKVGCKYTLVDIDWDTWAMKKNKPWLIAVFLGIDYTTPFIWGLEHTMKLGSRYETTRIQRKVGGCLFVAHMNPMGYSNDGPGLVASPVGWGPSTWCSKFFYHVTPWGIGSFFFGDSGKIDKSGSFRKMHILDVLVLLFFFPTVLFGIFVRLHPQQLEVPHFFCVILPQMSEQTSLVCQCLCKLVTMWVT